MNALFDCLASLGDRPLGTVLHIGAGHGPVLERYARLAPKRVVLVEGDPDAAAELQRRALAYPWAQVQATAVAAHREGVQWNRYNLPALNGPLDSAALRTYYPRLRLSGSRAAQAAALSDLIAELQVEADEQRLNVLVFDVPGQEAALLESLPQDQVVAFGAVLLRGCREALPPEGAAADDAVDQMQRRCFALTAQDADAEPLWPVSALRLDVVRYQAEQTAARVAALEAALAERDQSLQELKAAAADAEALAQQRMAQLDTLAQAKAAADKAAAESAAQIESLGKARDEQARLAAERQQELQLLTQAKAEVDGTAAERAAQIGQLTQARDEETRLAAERQTQLQALTQAKAELDKTAQERQAQVEALSQGKAAAEKAAAERAAQIEQLTKARDDQAKLAAERQAQLQALTQAKTDLEKDSEERQAQLDALTRAKVEAERTTRERQARLTEQQRRLLELERECKEATKRQQLLYEELIKAEAQIDLIKDVALREPGL